MGSGLRSQHFENLVEKVNGKKIDLNLINLYFRLGQRASV